MAWWLVNGAGGRTAFPDECPPGGESSRCGRHVAAGAPRRTRQKEKPVLGIPQVTGSTVQGTVDIKSDDIMNGADDAAMTTRSKIVRPIKGWKRR